MKTTLASSIFAMLISMGLSLAQLPPKVAGENTLMAMAQQSPQKNFPGYIARAFNGSSPTQAIAVVQSGADLEDNFKDLMIDELRGKVSQIGLIRHSIGNIILDKDTEVEFSIEGNLIVNRKDFGRGNYTKLLKKGKYPIEIRQWNDKNFSIVDSQTGASVVFYSGEMLSREAKRSVRLDGKTYKTVLLNEVAAKE